MSKQDLDKLQKQIEEKAEKRSQKKKPKMKVSGKSVIELKKIINKKSKG